VVSSLYVAWQDPTSRQWHTIARLQRANSGFELLFTHGIKRLHSIPSDLFGLDINKRYHSDELMPLFRNRLPSRSRPDFLKMAEWLNLSGSESEFDTLARFGLIPGTDSILMYLEPTITAAQYEFEFFVHGIRHMHKEALLICEKLRTGDRLLPLLDLQNPYDPNAVALRIPESPILLGYVPTFYAADVKQLLTNQKVSNTAAITVVRNNGDAPAQLRLLCKFRSSVPQEFRVLDTDTHRPLLDQAA
jgi:hypothetical protein